MKTTAYCLFLLSLFLFGCSQTAPAAQVDTLLVTDGAAEQRYTVEDLQTLGEAQAAFQGITYRGVPLARLLADAGYDPGTLTAVKATAGDGFTANYEPDLFNRQDTLVAYARLDAPLAEDEGAFRMVLPGQEGKLNPRQLVEIRIFP
jgi:DMSO/TMAO reductase YedYZ molybdopterin-dependent catalytic subunit